MVQNCATQQEKITHNQILQSPQPVENFILPAIEKIKQNDIQAGMQILYWVLDSRPNNYAALTWYGMGAFMSGDAATAVKYFEYALDINGNDPQLYANLGQAYMGIGDTMNAQDAFTEAFDQNPNDAEAAYYLGFFAEQEDDLEKAKSFYKIAIQNNPNLRNAYVQLANVYHLQDKPKEAFIQLRTAKELFPEDMDIAFIMGQFMTKNVPSWHLTMLADEPRNKAYYDALKYHVTKDDTVLDIGTGSGILAMMAARSGAKHVYACEANPILAFLASEIVSQNGLSDKVTIIEKHSSELVIGKDIPEKCDILVSEVFDSAIVGEDVLPTLRHAKKHLLKEDAKIIPEKATLYGRLTSSPHIHNAHYVDDVEGLDLSPMSDVSPKAKYYNAFFDFMPDSHRLSDEFEMIKFDFSKDLPESYHTNSTISVTETGTANSIEMYFTLHFADHIEFSSKDAAPQTPWYKASQILPVNQACQKGTSLEMKTAYTSYFDFQF